MDPVWPGTELARAAAIVNTATPSSPVDTAGFEDGFGKRTISVGPGGERLEVLALRDELTAVSSFESALRERVSALATFQNPSFVGIRGVLRHVNRTPALVVVAESVGGTRLSRMLAVAEERLLPIEISVALDLIRQLAYAAATLHLKKPGNSHGAIAPERIAVTTDARLVVLDHVFGAALEKLGYSHGRYWTELSIPLPNPADVPRFDARADVMQIGAVALALFAGRPLCRDEYPDEIGALADRVWGVTPPGTVEPLPSAVRTWLARALQFDGVRSFSSPVDAWAELHRILGGSSYVTPLASLRSFVAEYHKLAGGSASDSIAPALGMSSATMATADPVASPATAVDATIPNLRAVHTVPTVAIPNETPPSLSSAGDPLAAAKPADTPVAAFPKTQPPPASAAVRPCGVPLGFAADTVSTARQLFADEKVEDQMRNHVQWWRRPRIVAAAIVAAIACSGALAGRSYLTSPAAAEAPGTLVVDTIPAGMTAVIDGQPRGSTPLRLTLTPGLHTLELVTEGETRTIPLTITAGGIVSQFFEVPKAGPATGTLQVHTQPSGARVTVDGMARGTAPLTIEGLAPGPHTVVLVNGLGSVTQDVMVEAGATASLVVPMVAPQGAPMSGWISIDAPADVQIYEDTRLLGSSRSDRIMVAVGRHELDIVNDALGYRVTRVVNVGPGQVSPVRLDWPMGSMALNAQPWAEVWIDGERVGETPIGSLAVPIGTHDVIFRHPELGEQRVRTTVMLNSPARLSVDLRKR